MLFIQYVYFSGDIIFFLCFRKIKAPLYISLPVRNNKQRCNNAHTKEFTTKYTYFCKKQQQQQRIRRQGSVVHFEISIQSAFII